MKTMGFAAFRKHCRAVAVVEFAMTAPLVAVGLAGALDYGIMEWSKSCLINAVAQGAYYAYRTGTSVTPANVQMVVTNSSTLSSSLPGVTFKRAIAAVASYCPSGAPATLGTAVTAGSTCTDTSISGTNTSIAGKYLVITAYYQTIPIIPSYSGLSGSISETAYVRLQ